MIIRNGDFFIALHMHMLIMVNLSLEQLSALSWVMILVLKLINYGILKHIKHFIVETLCSMNLLCLLQIYLQVLLIRIRRVSMCRWSILMMMLLLHHLLEIHLLSGILHLSFSPHRSLSLKARLEDR
jgi:hypothetical protein